MTSQNESRGAAAVRRDRILAVGLKILAVAVADFVLVRLWGPDLVNRHQDGALALAILCFAVAIALTVWLGLHLWSGRSRPFPTEPISAQRGPDMET